jgi:Fe-S cluster assembly scaffold protein SufB
MVIDEYFNKIASKDDSLTALNTAFANEGAYVNIPRNKVVEKPIEIIYFSTGKEDVLLLQPRNLVVVGENAHVQIIERHQCIEGNPVLTNSVTEVFAQKRAIVAYLFVWREPHAQQFELLPLWRTHRFHLERHYHHWRQTTCGSFYLGESRHAQLRKPPELQNHYSR